MKRILIPIILFALILSGCGIKRDNPLDPYSNDNIIIPGDVTGLQSTVLGTGTSTPYIIFEWNSNNGYNTDGYIIYRSLGYFSAYAVVGTVLHVSGETLQTFVHSSANDHTVGPGDYWYRVSAYKDFPAGRLEGRLSTPYFVRIRNR